jgi:hypothetical protein
MSCVCMRACGNGVRLITRSSVVGCDGCSSSSSCCVCSECLCGHSHWHAVIVMIACCRSLCRCRCRESCRTDSSSANSPPSMKHIRRLKPSTVKAVIAAFVSGRRPSYDMHAAVEHAGGPGNMSNGGSGGGSSDGASKDMYNVMKVAMPRCLEALTVMIVSRQRIDNSRTR